MKRTAATALGTIGVVFSAMALSNPAGRAATAAPKLNGACTRAGATARAAAQSLVCTRVGARLVWRVAPSAPTTTAPATTRPPATTAAPSTTAARVASGEPVKVMQIVIDAPELGLAQPELKAAVQGRLDRLNKEGGVVGRPVKFDVCTAGFDPNKADDCARKAVSEGYIAVIGSTFANGDNWIRILDTAGIPSIGPIVLTRGDGRFTNSYPTNGGGVTAVGGAGAYLYDRVGARRIVITLTDSAAGQAAKGNIDLALLVRRTESIAITYPRNKPDLSAEVQRTIGLGDAITLTVTGGDWANAYRLLLASGYDKRRIVTAEGNVAPALRRAVGNDALEGLAIVSDTAPLDSGAKGPAEYLADQKSVNPALTTPDGVAKSAWAGAELFAQAAQKMKRADAASLVAAITTFTKFDANGMIAATDFSKPGSVLPDSPSVRNTAVQITTFNKGGEIIKTNGAWFDPFARV